MSIGRRVFGAAVFACGIVTLVWHNGGALGSIFAYVAGVAECAGGLALQIRSWARCGAIAIAATYGIYCLLSVQQIIAHPLVYWTWGNFFYPFSLAVAAGCVLSMPSPVARVLFGLCIASFGIEQAEFLARTASLVPKWIPPSQMFWAIATCVPFALAAIALFINRSALLASRLFGWMMFLFGVIVWIPILFGDPHTRGNWVEGSETFATAGAAWVLAETLRRAADEGAS